MNKRKLEQLKRIIPSIWNSYKHMCDVRRIGMQNKVNFLVLVISFFSVISINLFTYFENDIFLIPFLLQLSSFVILLKNFFIKEEFKVHWFESDKLIKDLDRGEFNQDLFADLKALEDGTWIYITEVGRNIKISLYLLLLSLYSLLLTLIFIHFDRTILFFLVLILTMISIFVICIYYKRQPNFQYESNYKKYKEQIDNWISK